LIRRGKIAVSATAGVADTRRQGQRRRKRFQDKRAETGPFIYIVPTVKTLTIVAIVQRVQDQTESLWPTKSSHAHAQGQSARKQKVKEMSRFGMKQDGWPFRSTEAASINNGDCRLI